MEHRVERIKPPRCWPLGTGSRLVRNPTGRRRPPPATLCDPPLGHVWVTPRHTDYRFVPSADRSWARSSSRCRLTCLERNDGVSTGPGCGVRREPGPTVQHRAPMKAVDLVLVTRLRLATDIPQQPRHGDQVAPRDSDRLSHLMIHSTIMPIDAVIDHRGFADSVTYGTRRLGGGWR